MKKEPSLDKLKPDDFDVIQTINEEHEVYLEKNRTNGNIYVKKTMYIYNLTVFEKLMAHPVAYIPRIFCLHEDGESGTLTVFEEYIHGDTLEYLLETQGKLTEGTVSIYLIKLCGILSELHSFDPPIIHRDIKPSNIILTKDDTLYLLDLNAGKLMAKGQARDTRMLGTRGYAAPEQYGFGSSVQATDIYAVGCLALALLTGDVAASAAYQGPLSPIINKCRAMDPSMRYESAARLKQALEKFLQTHRIPETIHQKSKKRFLFFPNKAVPIFLLFLILFAIIIYHTHNQAFFLPPSWWQKDVQSEIETLKSEDINFDDYRNHPLAALFGSYEGNTNGGLTFFPDGTAVYFCEESSYSEIQCPWRFEDGILTVRLEKIACDIYAVVENEDFSTLLFSSDSTNWTAETFKKLPDINYDYERSALKPYKKYLTVNEDGSTCLELKGCQFNIPKKYYSPMLFSKISLLPFPVMMSMNELTQPTNVLLFSPNVIVSNEKLLSNLSAYAGTICLPFFDDVKTGSDFHERIGDIDLYRVELNGTLNDGFNVLADENVSGYCVFILDGDDSIFALLLRMEHQDADTFEELYSIVKTVH